MYKLHFNPLNLIGSGLAVMAFIYLSIILVTHFIAILSLVNIPEINYYKI